MNEGAYTRAALLFLATAALLGLAYAYSRKLYVAELEVAWLEQIPVLDEDPA